MENEYYEVTVCVVTYNHESYIDRCLKSILSQKTSFTFNILIGEDCSLDGTRDIVEDYARRYPNIINLILNENNIGASDNFRKLHLLASGNYTAHVDGDDFWYPGKLQAQFDFLNANKKCPAVYTNAWVCSSSGEILGIFSSGVKKFFDLNYLIEEGNFLTNSSIFYRTNLKTSIIPFDGEFVDYLIHINLASHGYLGFVDEKYVAYTSGSNSSVISAGAHKVRLLIWRAICSVDTKKNNSAAIKKAKINILSSYILTGILSRDVNSVKHWVGLLFDSEHFEKFDFKLIIITPLQILEKIFKMIGRKFFSANSGQVVFYKK